VYRTEHYKQQPAPNIWWNYQKLYGRKRKENILRRRKKKGMKSREKRVKRRGIIGGRVIALHD